MPGEILYHDTCASPLGLLQIYTNGNRELVCLSLNATSPPGNGYTIKQADNSFIRDQLELYFRKRLTSFRVQLKPAGSPFQQAVWMALTSIPYGTTVSYGEIAGRIGRPSAVRAVGNAVGANPILLIIPCHRVIRGSGAIGGFACGVDKKEFLLELEGWGRVIPCEKTDGPGRQLSSL